MPLEKSTATYFPEVIKSYVEEHNAHNFLFLSWFSATM